MIRLCISLTLAMLFVACSKETPPVQPEPLPAQQKTMLTISGTVVLRERIGLTPESRLDIRLEDVSRADVPAIEIAKRSIDNPGQSPIPFSIDVDEGLIDQRMSYAIRAQVFDGDQLIFVSDSHNPVLTHGAGTDVTVNAVRLVASKRKMPDARFVGTLWMLKTVQGVQVPERSRGAKAYLLAGDNGQLQGFGSCNNFSGAYTLTGGRFAVRNIAATMMSCADVNDIEKSFLAALEKISTIAIQGQTMRAYDQEVLVATFEADNRR